MVIDEAVTLTGSYNWTRGAAANSEDLNLVSSPAVAAAYAAHCCERSRRLRPVPAARGLVPGLVARSRLRHPLMREPRPSSRSSRARRLRKLALLVTNQRTSSNWGYSSQWRLFRSAIRISQCRYVITRRVQMNTQAIENSP